MSSQPSPRPHIHRKVRHSVETALTDTRIVLIAGPRQAGKTTLVRAFADSDRPYLTLDDAGTLSAGKIRPDRLHTRNKTGCCR